MGAARAGKGAWASHTEAETWVHTRGGQHSGLGEREEHRGNKQDGRR